MPQRIASILRSLSRSVRMLMAVFMAVGVAHAQNLSFTPGVASIFAGGATGTSGANYTGPASGLALGAPGNITADANGNIYIVDTGNNILRVVAGSTAPIPTLPGVAVSPGQVYTVGGTTSSTSSSIPCTGGADKQGNGCPATQALITQITSMVIDPKGNIYLADGNYEQIRVIYGGTGALPGVTNPKAGYIYALTNVTNSGNDDSGDNGPAVDATTPYITSLAVDSFGNIYISDQDYYEIRMIYMGGSLPANFFPSGTTPTPGDIYFLTDGYSQCTDVASLCNGQPIVNAYYNYPMSAMSTDASGNVYLYDSYDNEVRVIYIAGKVPGLVDLVPGNIYAFAGTGGTGAPTNGSQATATPLTLTSFNFGGALYSDSLGNLYVTGAVNGNSIYKVDPAGVITTVFGGNAPCVAPTDAHNDGCAATSVSDAAFWGVAVDPAGNIYGADKVAQTGLILKSTVSTTSIDFASTVGISSAGPIFISNTGTQPLQLNNIALTPPFLQAQTGATDCTSSTSLATGASCQIVVSYIPTAVGASSGTITVSSNALNATSGTNTGVLGGTAVLATTTTSLVGSPSYPAVANIGEPVSFTATITPEAGNTLVPGGTVTFMNGGTQLGTATVTNGVATFSTSSLPAGKSVVTAVYGGSAAFITSTSNPANVTVSAVPVPVVVLTPSLTTATSGQSITLTANVTAFSGSAVPTGTVTFQDGPNPLPNGTVSLSGSTATLTTSALPPGNNELVAIYNGDGNFTPNSSTDVVVAVTPAGQLQLTPGVISLVAGSYFTSGAGGNNVPATSVAIGTVGPTGSIGVAVDSFGNTYMASGSLSVIASGNGPIPGVTSPVKGNIYTLGTGLACISSTTCGDGGPIAQASFSNPRHVVVDAFNNIYVSDFVVGGKGYSNSVIRKISATTGFINTVAGTWGTVGAGGDGGPATSALIGVWGLFADQNGNIYFADSTGLVVRRIDGQSNIITTVAGTAAGAWGNFGSGNPPNQCNTVPCGDGGPATSAQLVGPVGVYVDAANNIYIADSGYAANYENTVLRKVDGTTGIISLIGGQYSQFCTAAPCGDGGLISNALFSALSGITGDSGGNLYLADATLAVVREINAQTGIINTVVGTTAGEGVGGNLCATAPCGDGGPATSASLKSPQAVTLDSQGNMYVIDSGTDVVREISVANTVLAYGSQNLGTTTTQTVSVANIGLHPISFSSLSIPSPNYEQQPSGGADCTADTMLSSGASCQLSIAFFPTATGSLTGTATIASNSANATSGQNAIALSGTGVASGGTTAQTIAFPAVPAGLVYGSQPILLNASSSASGLTVTYEATGPATISGSTMTFTGAGTVKVTAYQFGDKQYAAATPVSQSFVVAPATLTVAAANLSLAAGAPLPAPTFAITGFANVDTQATTTTGVPALSVVDTSGTVYPVGSTLLSGTYTIMVKSGTLALTGTAANNYQLVYANGTLSVTGEQGQTLSFPPIGNVSYGASPIQLGASSTSGLPITYTVTGPATIAGNLLTVTGAGAVAVTANQIGTSQYSAATPLTVSFSVNKASLNVTANNVSVAQGSPIPALTYTIAGFVNGDTQAVVTGSPILTSTATNNSPIGQYPITLAAGTLSAANYSFNLVSGSNVSIVTPVAQTINFAPIAGVAYGAAPITLAAVSSSGLGVSYAVVGPASLSGNVLTIHGAGTVTVTASQAGNTTYGPASPVAQSFNVSPAVLTVTANDASRTNDTQNPAFTYTIIGFVNGDAANIAVSGTPALTTTATVSSPVGTYPIAAAIGNLTAANYTFNLVAGTLTITTGGPAPDFSLAVSPQSLSVVQGQIVQATITLSPLNFYQGLVKLSCGSLPANVTCTFSPATLAPNGAPVTGTLTVNTNTAAPVVGQIQPVKSTQVMSAAFFYLPAGICGLLIAFRRKQAARFLKPYQWLVLLLMLGGAAGLTACGAASSTSSNTTVAAPGSSVITLTAADSAGGPSHTINIGLKVQ